MNIYIYTFMIPLSQLNINTSLSTYVIFDESNRVLKELKAANKTEQQKKKKFDQQ